MTGKNIGVIRKYYYEKYDAFQNQLMVIAGGTLTVFVSINAGNQTQCLYSWGFSLLGFSLIAGVLSLVMFQVDFIIVGEYGEMKSDLEVKSTINNKRTIVLLDHYIEKRYFEILYLIFSVFQLILFLSGVVLILIGLLKG